MKLNELIHEVFAVSQYDPNIFKAIFIVGASEASKSYMIDQLALTSYGLKLVDTDAAFTDVLKKITDTLNLAHINDAVEVIGPVSKKVKDITYRSLDRYVEGRMGLIISGTASDISTIKKHYSQLKEVGYDQYVIFVNTNLETTLKLNIANAAQSIPVDIATITWHRHSSQLGMLFSVFGIGHVKIIDNSEGVDITKNIQSAQITITKWINAPLSYVARLWIQEMVRGKKIIKDVK
ncbi:MAG: hypothetical protein IPG55_16535 [Saprospiraceae bacterium]|nr:hypothetical protein [Candidatus Defluviibacterium haderslevense]